MKKLPLYVAILGLALSCIALYYSKSSSELVYVDVNKLVEGYKKTKISKAEYEKKAIKIKANLDSLIVAWQVEIKDYEKNRTTYSPTELKLKQQLLGNKQNQINGYQEAIQNQIKEEEKKMTQTIINDINDYVKEYGRNKGYKIIFGASGNGTIMYAEESTDLTEEVLKGLNEEYSNK